MDGVLDIIASTPLLATKHNSMGIMQALEVGATLGVGDDGNGYCTACLECMSVTTELGSASEHQDGIGPAYS